MTEKTMQDLLEEVTSENNQAEQLAFEQYSKDQLREQLKNVERNKKALVDAEEHMKKLLNEDFMREKFNTDQDLNSRKAIKEVLTSNALNSLLQPRSNLDAAYR